MSNIPDYYELRLTLTEIENLLVQTIGGTSVINVGETMRVMLGEYFYSEPAKTIYPHHTSCDRTIVWPLMGQTLFGQDLTNAIETIGDIFWVLADTIQGYILRVNSHYDHKPSECFYHFHPDTKVLVAYVPVIAGINDLTLQAKLDGRAVVQTCAATLPSWYRR